MTTLDQASDLEDLTRIVRALTRELTDAFGATMILLDEDQCFYADEDATSPLWKGQRFPLDRCIASWAMIHRRPAVVADIQSDERIPQAAYAPPFVRSMVMVPVGDPPVGAIGAYWPRARHATRDYVEALVHLADAALEPLCRIRSTTPMHEPGK